MKAVDLLRRQLQASATEAKQPADAFHEKTGATVNIVVIPDPFEGTVATRLATGDKPDIAFYQPSLSALPNIQPANDLLPLDDQPWVSKLNKVGKSLGVIDGVRYAAVVKPPAVSGVYYNKAVFAAAGITKIPTSWDEMIKAAEVIKKASPDVAPFYQAGADKWPLQWPLHSLLSGVVDKAFWSKLNEDKAKWTDPKILNAVEKYKADLIDSGLSNANYQTGTFEQQASSLLDGSTGMVFQVDALMALLLANTSVKDLDKQIGWFPISANGANAQFTADQTNGIVAFKSDDLKREDATKAFIDFWMGEDYADFIAANKYLSIETDVPSPTSLPAITRAQADALPTATGMYYVYAIATPSTRLYLNDMIFGAKTPEQVVKAMQDEFVQLATAKGAPGF